MTDAIDITPMVPAGNRLITSYGGSRFRVANNFHQGSVIILPNSIVECHLAFDETFDASMIQPLIDAADQFDLLIVGCGEAFIAPPKELRPLLKSHGIILEWMDTGAACRTFNVLLGEGRSAAAALVATE